MSLPRPKHNPIEGAVLALIRRIARGPAPGAGQRPVRPSGVDDNRLDDAAVRLLERLPAQLRLVALRGLYPRLLNRLAAAWGDPAAFEAAVDSLLIDQRGGRQGFPFEVLAELTELREYHRSIRPRGPGRS